MPAQRVPVTLRRLQRLSVREGELGVAGRRISAVASTIALAVAGITALAPDSAGAVTHQTHKFAVMTKNPGVNTGDSLEPKGSIKFTCIDYLGQGPPQATIALKNFQVIAGDGHTPWDTATHLTSPTVTVNLFNPSSYDTQAVQVPLMQNPKTALFDGSVLFNETTYFDLCKPGVSVDLTALATEGNQPFSTFALNVGEVLT